MENKSISILSLVDIRLSLSNAPQDLIINMFRAKFFIDIIFLQFPGQTIIIFIGPNCVSLQEEFEDTKEIIRIHKSKKDRQHNGQNKSTKGQRSTKHTHKTKDRVTRTPLKTGGELRCSGRVSSFCSTSGPRRVNLVKNPLIILSISNNKYNQDGIYYWQQISPVCWTCVSTDDHYFLGY